jgi:uncharacterized protein with FMN-binding domain
VAASCAAVLTVYAAGYWRTRDAARRLDAQTQERRPVRPEAPVAAGPIAPVIEAPAPTPQPPAAPEIKPAKKLVAKAATPPPPAAAPEPAVAKVPAIMSVPLDPEPKEWPAPPPSPESLPDPVTGWHDGTYTGWGQSYHGDIEAKVVIEKGRIVASGVATCATRYPCDVLHTILNQPVWTQSPDVDRVSRATESADAYYQGLVEALEHAVEGKQADTATSE